MSAEQVAAWSGFAVVVLGALTTMVVRIVQEAKKSKFRRGESFQLRNAIDANTRAVQRCTVCTEELHEDIRSAFGIPKRERKDSTPRLGLVVKKDE